MNEGGNGCLLLILLVVLVLGGCALIVSALPDKEARCDEAGYYLSKFKDAKPGSTDQAVYYDLYGEAIGNC